jgi:ABC-2 type transport system ATP-binding protein
MSYVIEVNHLSKSYGPIKALRDISFSIPKGSVVGLLGPNGAGKTTLIRTLMGLSDGDRGTIQVCGRSVIHDREAISHLMGYMPENNPLPEDMRVKEYLYYRALLKKIPLNLINKRLGELMELCDLDPKARQKPIRNLSKGYRQRVGIADTLLAKPPIIILDEPTIGLDPHQIISLRKLMDSLKQEATLIVSSHILQEVEASCDTVIILNQGHIVASGTPEALKAKFLKGTRYHLSTNVSLESFKQGLGDSAPLNSIRLVGEDEGRVTLEFETLHSEGFYSLFLEALRKHTHWEIYAFHTLEPSLEAVFIAATEQHWKTLKI